MNDQIAKLPPEIRDRLSTNTRIEVRLRELEAITPPSQTTDAGDYRFGWLVELAESDRVALAKIRRLERDLDALLDEHGTTLRDEVGIATVGAATLLCEVGNPFRFATESKFARWSGTGAIAVSSGEGDGEPIRHRLDWGGNRTINAVLYRMSVTQQRCHEPATTYINRKRSEGKTRREARRAHKRLLANRVIRRMWRDEQQRQPNHKTEELPAAA
ncbi:MAG: IS110 family transposase [bacterium]|nr:IS110 family transposase [bacterium]